MKILPVLFWILSYGMPSHGQSVVLAGLNVTGRLSSDNTREASKNPEYRHFSAVAQFLAAQVCVKAFAQQAEIIKIDEGSADAAVIGGCPKDQAELVGALLGSQFGERQVFIFHPETGKKTGWLLTFRTSNPGELVLATMKRLNVPQATLALYRPAGYVVYVWCKNERSRETARKLASALNGQEETETAGVDQLLVQNATRKSEKTFAAVIAQVPNEEASRLEMLMKSEQLRNLGLK